jgi:hypothetical protein
MLPTAFSLIAGIFFVEAFDISVAIDSRPEQDCSVQN